MMNVLPQENRILIREVADVIERLQPKRRAILLADLRGDSHAEIAAAQRVPLGTVKSSLFRVTAVLRAEFEGAERQRPSTKNPTRRPALRRAADGASPVAKVSPSGEGDIQEVVLSELDAVSWRKLQRWLRLGTSLVALVVGVHES
jgi:hypothetical protein